MQGQFCIKTMETMKWLVCIFERKDLDDVNKVFVDNGFRVWTGYDIGETCSVHLYGPRAQIDRVGSVLVGIAAPFPMIKMQLIDKDSPIWRARFK